MGVSVVINTLNEERNIRACLETVTWADEIIIVDMHSDDRTVEIAREFTDRIFTHERIGYVEPARNFAIQQATQDWILVLDADERITDALKSEIQRIAQNETLYRAFKVRRRDYQYGKFIDYSSLRLHSFTRLFRKGYCKWSSVIHSEPSIEGSIGILHASLEHYSHLTIESYLAKLNRYTDVEAQKHYMDGIRRPLWKAFYRATGKFIKELTYYRAYKDGGHGFIVAALYAFYYFASDIKTWELWYKHDHGLLTPSMNDSQTRPDLQSNS